MNKEYYEEPNLKVSTFANVDILNVSGGDENELPPVPID